MRDRSLKSMKRKFEDVREQEVSGVLLIIRECLGAASSARDRRVADASIMRSGRILDITRR
jgi:hypothetical protein